MAKQPQNTDRTKDQTDSPDASDERRQGNVNQAGVIQQDTARQHGIGQTDENEASPKRK